MDTVKTDALLEENELDAILVSRPANIRYLSGYAGEESYLWVAGGCGIILTDSRYSLQAGEESGGLPVRTIGAGVSYGTLLKDLVSEFEVKRLGFEEDFMLYGTVKSLQKASGLGEDAWTAVGGALSSLRSIKTPKEVELLSKAESIGDEAFSLILKDLRPGLTELMVAAKLEYYMKSCGAEGVSFGTIAASGLHSAMPHALPGTKVIEEGDFLTMDFGCKYRGYCSDMTRTVVIGKASARQREIYDLVLKAQQTALDGLRPGMKGKEGDALARDVIAKAGYGEYFGHGTGHSVGLEIHESPALSPRDETVLLPGMIETVEPGIYIPGFGGVRIEDMAVITDDGIRNLTSSPKELIEI